MLFAFLISTSCLEKKGADFSKPNVIYILADDLGYGELGCYGQTKIETPNIDALASDGMIFTDHYSGSPVCAPSRCILLTGKHSGHAYVRGNDEWNERGDVWNYKAMAKDPSLEGQRPIPDSLITIGEVLQNKGYTTGFTGKWGLGAPNSEGIPNRQGFDYFYGYNCQRQAHTLYPLHLWENDNRTALQNDTIAPHQKLKVGADPEDPNSYSPFIDQQDYAPTHIFDATQKFINKNKDVPFFLIWASPIPHVPLQAPERWVNYYRNKFGPEKPYTATRGYFPCQYPNATYAAMISYLDENVGKLVQQLKELGLYENTLIMFSSDNGPTYAGGVDAQWFDSCGPFRCEEGWGKGSLREGGIRVPMIATWPDVIKPSSRTNHVSAFWDIFPTICEITKVERIPPNDGLSFFSTLVGKQQANPDYLYWEFPEYGGQRALRMGKWKAFQNKIHDGNTSIQLYDLENDIQEQIDLSVSNPELMDSIKIIFEKEHRPSFNPMWQFVGIDSILRM